MHLETGNFAVGYPVFLLATTLFILFPGPSIMLTVSQSLRYGFRLTMASVAGTSAAIVLQLAVTWLGMAPLMTFLSEALPWLRWLGVAYLLWLGLAALHAPADAGWTPQDKAPQYKGNAPGAPGLVRLLFMQGFVVSAANPKSWFFYGAFFPQFVSGSSSMFFELAMMSLSFLLIAAVFTGAYAALAGRLAGWFSTPARRVLKNRIAGLLLMGAALLLALARLELGAGT